MKILWSIGTGLAMLATVSLAATGSGFDEALLRAFVTMRSGTGEPVYWPCSGEVYSFPEGKLLFLMEGYDAARLVTRPGETGVFHSLAREIFVYRDTTTGEVLRTWNGKPMDRIGFAMPFMHHTYRFANGEVSLASQVGDEKVMRAVGPITGTRVHRRGRVTTFSMPLFVNRETPRGPYQVHESNDFSIVAGDPPEYHLAWVRYGDLPAFAGPGLGVMHMTCQRVDRFEDVPEFLRTFIEQHAPRWKAPPASLDEFPKPPQ